MSSSEEMRAGRRKAANMRLVVSLRPLIMAAFGLASEAAGGPGRSGGAAEAEAKVEAATEKRKIK